MRKVKVISDNSPEGLEDQINLWLDEGYHLPGTIETCMNEYGVVYTAILFLS